MAEFFSEGFKKIPKFWDFSVDRNKDDTSPEPPFPTFPHKETAMFSQLPTHDLSIVIATAMTVLLFERIALYAWHKIESIKESDKTFEWYEVRLLRRCGGSLELMRLLVRKQFEKDPNIDLQTAIKRAYIALLTGKDSPSSKPDPNAPKNPSMGDDDSANMTPKEREEYEQWKSKLEDDRHKP